MDLSHVDYLWCFYQLFGLSFWRHPFTAEDTLVGIWCNAKFLQICSDEETNSSTSWMVCGWVNLKLQSVSFASLSPSLFENLELQLCAELSSVRGVVIRHGSSADESNVLKSMCVSLSGTAAVWILYLGITDSSLRLGIYDPNKNFHHIRIAIWISNKSATFVLPNWRKRNYSKSCYQW